jgi:hypothetical protein
MKLISRVLAGLALAAAVVFAVVAPGAGASALPLAGDSGDSVRITDDSVRITDDSVRITDDGTQQTGGLQTDNRDM